VNKWRIFTDLWYNYFFVTKKNVVLQLMFAIVSGVLLRNVNFRLDVTYQYNLLLTQWRPRITSGLFLVSKPLSGSLHPPPPPKRPDVGFPVWLGNFHTWTHVSFVTQIAQFPCTLFIQTLVNIVFSSISYAKKIFQDNSDGNTAYNSVPRVFLLLDAFPVVYVVVVFTEKG
jgi:hypothetical protein